jgi:hypothetical protein
MKERHNERLYLSCQTIGLFDMLHFKTLVPRAKGAGPRLGPTM